MARKYVDASSNIAIKFRLQEEKLRCEVRKHYLLTSTKADEMKKQIFQNEFKDCPLPIPC